MIPLLLLCRVLDPCSCSLLVVFMFDFCSSLNWVRCSRREDSHMNYVFFGSISWTLLKLKLRIVFSRVTGTTLLCSSLNRTQWIAGCVLELNLRTLSLSQVSTSECNSQDWALHVSWGEFRYTKNHLNLALSWHFKSYFNKYYLQKISRLSFKCHIVLFLLSRLWNINVRPHVI